MGLLVVHFLDSGRHWISLEAAEDLPSSVFAGREPLCSLTDRFTHKPHQDHPTDRTDQANTHTASSSAVPTTAVCTWAALKPINRTPRGSGALPKPAELKLGLSEGADLHRASSCWWLDRYYATILPFFLCQGHCFPACPCRFMYDLCSTFILNY